MSSGSSSPSLAEVGAHYLARLSASERQRYQQEVNRFIRWCGGDRPIGDLTVREVANYSDWLGVSTPNPVEKLEIVKAFLAYSKKERLIGTNLAVHLRLRKASPKPATASRASSPGVVHLTPQGFAELKEELDTLQRERPRIAQEIRRAAADKDFRENAPLDAAKDYQGQVEARIRELETTLKGAVLLEETPQERDMVSLGSVVSLRDLASEEQVRYALVNPSEVDLARGKISVASPLGRALLNRGPGEIIEVAAPAGLLRYRIEAIEG